MVSQQNFKKILMSSLRVFVFALPFLAICGSVRAADPGTYAGFESNMQRIRSMTGEFNYVYLTERRTVSFDVMIEKMTGEYNHSAGIMADFYGKQLVRVKNGDFSGFTDFDPYISSVDTDLKVVVYDTPLEYHATVSGSKYVTAGARRFERANGKGWADLQSFSFDGALAHTSLVSTHPLASHATRRHSENRSVGKDGLASGDPRSCLFFPICRTEGEGRFVFSDSDSTTEAHVYVKQILDPKTSRPKAWARITLRPESCVPLSYRDGGYDDNGEATDFAQWDATYSPDNPAGADIPSIISVVLQNGHGGGTRSEIAVTGWEDYSKSGKAAPQDTMFLLSQ